MLTFEPIWSKVMSPAHKLGCPPRQAFCSWLERPLGRRLLEVECSELECVLPRLFGYHLVQLGALCEGVDLLSSSRIWHRLVLEAAVWPKAQPPGLLSRADALPFANASVDVMLLPHILEYELNPHQVLREVQRVLVPYGAVVILGFNPWSFWGLWRRLLCRWGNPPWCGRFYSLTRLRDWLALLGFETVELRYFLFRPPLHHPKWMQRLRFLEETGQRWWPLLAGGYIVVAKKQVMRLNPVDPLWREERNLDIAGLAEPSAREGCHD